MGGDNIVNKIKNNDLITIRDMQKKNIPNVTIGFNTINSGFANFLKQNGITSEQLTNFNKAEIAGLYDSYLGSINSDTNNLDAVAKSQINLNNKYSDLLDKQTKNIDFGNYIAIAGLGLNLLGMFDARKYNKKQIGLMEDQVNLSKQKYNDLKKWRKKYSETWK